MVGLPVTLLCCLKLYLSLSPQLKNKVALLVQVCQFLKLSPGIFCILNKRGIDEIANLSALIDIKSLETLAAVELCIDYMPFHDVVLLNVRMVSLSRLALEHPAVAGACS